MKILITGASGGIGQATKKLLIQRGYEIDSPSRKELDLADFESLDELDLRCYDVIINCAGANNGAYQGWQNNTWQNQQNHVAVNFTGPLLLAKQYTRQRNHGHFIYITSTSVEDPISYTIFMVGSKLALRHSLNAVRRDYPNFVFSEIVPGKTKTNMLRQNYQGSRTEQEIAEEYAKSPTLDPQQVAQAILLAIDNKLEMVRLSPRKHMDNK